MIGGNSTLSKGTTQLSHCALALWRCGQAPTALMAAPKALVRGCGWRLCQTQYKWFWCSSVLRWYSTMSVNKYAFFLIWFLFCSTRCQAAQEGSVGRQIAQGDDYFLCLCLCRGTMEETLGALERLNIPGPKVMVSEFLWFFFIVFIVSLFPNCEIPNCEILCFKCAFF